MKNKQNNEATPDIPCKRLSVALFCVAAAATLFAFLFPLIIWDALGGGAMHFMQYSHVSVSGDSSGNSAATFFFGIGYSMANMGGNLLLIPSQLFSAQWRVLMGTTELATPAADGLGVITMILTILFFISVILTVIVYVFRRFTYFKIMRPVSKYFSISAAAIELFTVIWFLIVIFGLMSNVGSEEFKFGDFVAYGGIKFILEAAFSAALCAMNTIYFLRVLRKQSTF